MLVDLGKKDMFRNKICTADSLLTQLGLMRFACDGQNVKTLQWGVSFERALL